VIVAHQMRGLSPHASEYTILHGWVYMESIVRFSTVENPMNCRVFKVNLIEKLFEKLKLANSTIFEFCSVIRIWTHNLSIEKFSSFCLNRLDHERRLWVQIRITEQNSKIVEFANFNFSNNFSIKFTLKTLQFIGFSTVENRTILSI
jgi:hypothetical protein